MLKWNSSIKMHFLSILKIPFFSGVIFGKDRIGNQHIFCSTLSLQFCAHFQSLQCPFLAHIKSISNVSQKVSFLAMIGNKHLFCSILFWQFCGAWAHFWGLFSTSSLTRILTPLSLARAWLDLCYCRSTFFAYLHLVEWKIPSEIF